MINRNLQIIALVLITLVAFVANNGTLDANIMEARNLTTAREILQKNNWLEPTMNGEIRLEKPPLPTWITAVTMYFSGQENLSLLRLPAAFAAMLLIFFIFKLTTEMSDDRYLPFLVSGTASTSFYIFFLARDISWDIFCHSFMLGAIWLIFKGLKSRYIGWSEFICAGFLMGLSFMSKGPVAFYALLLPFLIAMSFTFGWKEASNKKMALSVMVIITLLISLWWPLMIWFSHPDFSAMVAQQESSAWINRSTHPFYHYWSFPVQSGVWTILAVIALWFPYAKKRIDHFGNYSFLAFWTISSVILLSLFPEKKERYLLPVLIPLAMMVACYTRYLIEAFNEKFTTKSDLIIFQVNTIIMLMVSSMIPVALFVYLKETGKPAFGTLILSAFLFWGLTCLFVISLLRKKILLLWYAMCGIVLALCLVLMPWAPEISVTNPNFHPYQELRHREDLKNANFYFNGEIPGKFIEVIWNSGHEIKSWDPWKNPQLPGRLPILFLSYQDPTTVLPADILSHYQIEVIGHFDSNPTKKGGNIVLANYATLIR